MKTQVTLTMKEQHKLKMVIDYEAGKVRALGAVEQSRAMPGLCIFRCSDDFQIIPVGQWGERLGRQGLVPVGDRGDVIL